MAIVKKRKPPPRQGPLTGFGGGQGRAAVMAAPKLQAKPLAAARFQPAKTTWRPTTFKKTLGPPRMNPKAYAPPGPGQMPYEFDPNADTNTVQGNINAGNIQWTPGLGKLGYRPPARAPSGINIPGYSPDLSGAVGGDWELAAAMGDVEAANAADEAAAGENINALAVGWGGDLSNLVQQGLITQGAAEAAAKNQFSTMAELQRSLEQGQGRGQAQLAARGILSSGALPGLSAELNRQFQQESTTGLAELMSQIRGIRSSQAQARAERTGGLANVRANVANRLSQLQAYQPIPAQTATWDPQVQAYVDDWGRRFDRKGTRLS